MSNSRIEREGDTTQRDPRGGRADGHRRRGSERVRRRLSRCLIAIVLGGVASHAWAQEPKAAGPMLRTEMGAPVQTAIELLKQKKGKEALASIAEADGMKDKTAYETYVIERLRGQALTQVGDASGAAHAFESAAASPAAPAGERTPLLAAAVSQYYIAKDYRKSVELGDRYFREGGTDKAVRTLLVQSLYLANDFARAVKEIAADMKDDVQAGRTPAEQQLQLLASATDKLGDRAAYMDALEQLVTYYPRRDYWLSVMYTVSTGRTIAARFALDVARLKIATGTMRTGSEYVDAAQLALQEGLPAEGAKIIDKGYAAHLLGVGADADRHRRLKALAARDLAEDRRTRAQTDAEAAASDNTTALLNGGFNRVLDDDVAKGIAMMEDAMRKGRIKHPDDARLHLGYAYVLAGNKAKAAEMFKTVRGTDGASTLARLWLLHLGR